MRLVEFEYTDGLWTLHPIHFVKSNLFVGTNSTGKSRAIEAIRFCSDFIAQKEVLHHFFNMTGIIDCKMTFEDSDSIIKYNFSIRNNKVKSERLVQITNGRESLIIRRSIRTCSLNREKITPPVDKLLIQVRRDKQQYPIFEKIIHWAENTFFIPFSMLKNLTLIEYAKNGPNISDYLLALSKEQKEHLIEKVNTLNYKIKDIKVEKIGEAKFPVIVEEGIKALLPIFTLSIGMVCAIYILILLEYLSNREMPSCILVDDFSEGLDYERSKELGKLVFDYSSKNGIDIIVSSNDSFLMDIVPIDCWIILTRNGSEVSNLSKRTHPDLFEEFSFTGLNNFMLFSSNYIERYLSKHKSKDE